MDDRTTQRQLTPFTMPVEFWGLGDEEEDVAPALGEKAALLVSGSGGAIIGVELIPRWPGWLLGLALAYAFSVLVSAVVLHRRRTTST